MPNNSLTYNILGESLQVVEIILAPGETIIAEAGAMNYMDKGITFQSVMGDGAKANSGFTQKIFSASKRAFTGESVFMTHFTNQSRQHKCVAFAAPYPGTILPIDLAQNQNELLCQKGAFLCAALGTSIGMAFNRRIGAGLLGGEGFVLQHLQGETLAFIHAGGTLIEKTLDNEVIYIDTGCVAAFSKSLDYSIEKAGNLKSMMFSGEGRFLARLAGSGTAYLQSMPLSRFADRLSDGESSMLGGFGRWIGGS